jgi:hypothetical protein
MEEALTSIIEECPLIEIVHVDMPFFKLMSGG